MAHEFCQQLLKEILKEVKQKVPDYKKGWSYKYQDGKVEFHFKKFYWYGRGCCLYYAKATGWTHYLDHNEPAPTDP